MKSELKKLPSLFLERLKKIVGLQKFDSTANTFAEDKPTTFRVNTLKTTPIQIQQELSSQEFRIDAVPWYPEAFIVRKGRLRELQETKAYQEGRIYVQNLSSMLPPLVLAPEGSENILDLAAAPGSKTTQIAMMMKGQGKIIANDNNKIRFFKLKANLELQGCTNVEATLKYGETFGREYPEMFDRVLLDAPCSSEGRFSAHEPSSYSYWKPGKTHEMAQKQKKLMSSALHALRVGGILVYSTCTFAPEENEEVLDWALKRFPNVFQIENIQLSLQNQTPGLMQWEDKKFDPSVYKAKRILPTGEMEGFFVAKLRKLNSLKA